MSDQSHRRENKPVPTQVGLKGPATLLRQQAEDFIWQSFQQAYGADIIHFMPYLLTLRGTAGDLLGVLGLRHPGEQALFLEQYLDCPAEAALSAARGETVLREQLIEVGNFAVAAAGGGRWLITTLTAYLYSAGLQWAVFTCGPTLRNAFQRLSIPLIDLGPADPASLSQDELGRWGSYYEQKPRVMAANVAASHAALVERFNRDSSLQALWQEACHAGLNRALIAA